MNGLGLTNAILLPIGLGLLGFVEPCSIGSILIVIKHLEGRDAAGKLVQIGAFAGTRAIFTGILGMLAVVLGAAFLGFQRGAWIGLGGLYVGLGRLFGRNSEVAGRYLVRSRST
jgi:cytochrome c-type biogenesis protein